MIYKAVHIVLTEEADKDALIGKLSLLQAIGFEESERKLEAYFEEKDFPDPQKLAEVLTGFPYKIEDLQDRNWNEEWEKSFQPIRIEDFCGIRAHFHPAMDAVKYELLITPMMSFGTGHHATTRLMLRLMKDLDFSGKRVLDFGTGTGILSILSAKMGATDIKAMEKDAHALRNAEENIHQNKVKGIELIETDHLEKQETAFDLILANVVKNVILQNAENISTSCASSGLLLLSGFFKNEIPEMLEVFGKRGFRLKKSMHEDRWAGLLLSKLL